MKNTIINYFNRVSTSKFAVFVLLIILLVFGLLFIRVFIFVDGEKDELISYLKELKIAHNEIITSNFAKEYTLKVLGLPDDDIIEKDRIKLIQKGVPSVEAFVKSFDQAYNLAKSISNRTSLAKKQKIKVAYEKYKLDVFRGVVPIRLSIQEIHNHLLKSLEFRYKSYSLICDSIDLGKFFDLREKDGALYWRYYSDKETNQLNKDIESCSEISDAEMALFKSSLIRLIKTKNMEVKGKKFFSVDLIDCNY